MDETAKRREARRRKILENSATRLQKITGIEQKSTNTPLEEDPDAPPVELLKTSPSAPVVTSTQPPETNNEIKKPQRLTKIVVVASLAVFVTYFLVIAEKVFKADLSSSSFNKIFMPVLAYEVIEFVSNPSLGTTNFAINLLLAGSNNPQLRSFVNYLGICLVIVQDVMIYFFVFVCCQIVKNALWPSS